MRLSVLFLALFWAQPGRPAGPAPQEYHARREALRARLRDGLTVLFGRSEPADDLPLDPAQEPDFYYLTGIQERGAMVLLAPLPENAGSPGYREKAALPREILFLPRRNPAQERWTGPRRGPDDADIRQATGFDQVMASERFESELHAMMSEYGRLYTLTGVPAAARLQALAPLRELANAGPAIARLRRKKSEAEIALIQRSVDATVDAHLAAWKRAAAGLYEYQVAATMMAAYFDEGCERNAYPPIVASGPNATILHYDLNRRRMDRGELLLMDVGAECSGYAADVTRTIPVGGRFSPRQRQLYDVVLGAQKAVIAAIRPGTKIGSRGAPDSLNRVAFDYINSHGKDLHGQPLGKYFIHGVSHHVGLEVHDPGDPAAPLEEDNVITVEPGIYIPEEGLGVRIEDTVLVTRDGARVMSAALPREPAQIEKAMAK